MRGISVEVIVILLITGIVTAGFFVFNGQGDVQFSPDSCNNDESQLILKLSAESNAHGETYNANGFQNPNINRDVCFDDYFGGKWEGQNPHDGGLVLRLSGATNAHAEGPNGVNYNTLVKYGDLSCTLISSGNVCPDNSVAILMLSDTTNAHLALPGRANYPYKLCCSSGEAPPIEPECGNDIREGDEECDGDDFGGYGNGVDQCKEYDNRYERGDLICTNECEIDVSQCDDGGGGDDFCNLPENGGYAPFTKTYEGEPPEILVVSLCDEYNEFTEEYNLHGAEGFGYDGDLNEFTSRSCELDCANAQQNEFGFSCKWSDEEEECQSVRVDGGIECRLEYEYEGECGPDDLFRNVRIRVINVNGGPIEECEGPCDGAPECVKQVQCPKVIVLPFFNKLNLVISLVVIGLIYLILHRKKEGK